MISKILFRTLKIQNLRNTLENETRFKDILSIFRTSFSFLNTSLLAVTGISFRAVVGLEAVVCLFYLTISEILLDFFLLDLRGLVD